MRDQGEWHFEVDLGGLTWLESKSKEADELLCRPGDARGSRRSVKWFLTRHSPGGERDGATASTWTLMLRLSRGLALPLGRQASAVPSTIAGYFK